MRAYACPDCGGWHLTTYIYKQAPKGAGQHWRKPARRPAKGQTIEDLAAQIRAERLEG